MPRSGIAFREAICKASKLLNLSCARCTHGHKQEACAVQGSTLVCWLECSHHIMASCSFSKLTCFASRSMKIFMKKNKARKSSVCSSSSSCCCSQAHLALNLADEFQVYHVDAPVRTWYCFYQGQFQCGDAFRLQLRLQCCVLALFSGQHNIWASCKEGRVTESLWYAQVVQHETKAYQQVQAYKETLQHVVSCVSIRLSLLPWAQLACERLHHRIKAG